MICLPVGAQRVGGIEQLVGNLRRNICEHHKLLEECADEDDGNLLFNADADPQDEQRDH